MLTRPTLTTTTFSRKIEKVSSSYHTLSFVNIHEPETNPRRSPWPLRSRAYRLRLLDGRARHRMIPISVGMWVMPLLICSSLRNGHLRGPSLAVYLSRHSFSYVMPMRFRLHSGEQAKAASFGVERVYGGGWLAFALVPDEDLTSFVCLIPAHLEHIFRRWPAVYGRGITVYSTNYDTLSIDHCAKSCDS